MAWRLARSLEVLRDQVNAAWPGRSKQSDGTIGDEAHQSRQSDHNPWVDGGVVTAIDITDDPGSGADMDLLAEALRASRDPRIKYVIHDGRIFASYHRSRPAWEWGPYSGPNPHRSHLHLSVQPDRHLYDDTSPWAMPEEENMKPLVEAIQTALNEAGFTDPAGQPLKVDGIWGPKTQHAFTTAMVYAAQKPKLPAGEWAEKDHKHEKVVATFTLD